MDLSIIVPLYNEEDSSTPSARGLGGRRVRARPRYRGRPRRRRQPRRDPSARWSSRARDPRLRVRRASLPQLGPDRRAWPRASTRARRDHRQHGRRPAERSGRHPAAWSRASTQGYDVVVRLAQGPPGRVAFAHASLAIANRLIAAVTGMPIHDNGCSLKAYRAEVMRSLHLYAEMHRFLPALSLDDRRADRRSRRAPPPARARADQVRHLAHVQGPGRHVHDQDGHAVLAAARPLVRPAALPWLALAARDLGRWLGGLWIWDRPARSCCPRSRSSSSTCSATT